MLNESSIWNLLRRVVVANQPCRLKLHCLEVQGCVGPES